MKIVHIQAREIGTVAKRIRSTTAGFSSGYQRVNTATSGIGAVATTGGDILTEVVTLPWYSPIPLNETDIEIPSDLLAPQQDELALGYEAMATENSLLAEESLPIAQETWPTWKE